MPDLFQRHIDSLPSALQRLLEMPATKCDVLTHQIPKRGVYLFSEGIRTLYVGRSNRLRARIRNHGNPCATHRQAAFAIRLAREQTKKFRTFTRKGSISELMLDSAFVAAFTIAKERISAMDVRFVEESDPVRQCLLEIYVAVTLNTPYNDFDNH